VTVSLKKPTTKHRSHQSKPDSSGYTICGAGFAALAIMVFERIAGLSISLFYDFVSFSLLPTFLDLVSLIGLLFGNRSIISSINSGIGIKSISFAVKLASIFSS